MDLEIQGLASEFQGRDDVVWNADEIWGARIGEIIREWHGLNNVESFLDLSMKSINILTREKIHMLRALKVQKLDISVNNLASLPESVSLLVDLRVLILHGNYLSKLPESFGQLTNLEVLNAENNQLTTLSDTLGNLKKLKELTLDYNKFLTLPDEVPQLAQLEKLSLVGNILTSLPETLGTLANLSILYLSQNDLSSLPSTLGDLENLTALNLSFNKLPVSSLCELATVVRRSKTLKRLFIYESPGSTQDEVIHAFARALRSNNSLVDFALSRFSIARTLMGKYDSEIVSALERNVLGNPAPEPYHPMIKAAHKR